MGKTKFAIIAFAYQTSHQTLAGNTTPD